MDSRQQFEWWQCEADDGPHVDPMWMMYDVETNTYGLDLIQSDWKTWQKSRESLVVELPENYPFNKKPKYESDRAQTIRECRDALTAAGIRTK